MNEIRYKKGLPSLEWNNSECSDLLIGKDIGGMTNI